MGWKKSFVAAKVRKKCVENVGRKKSSLSKFMKNMLTRKLRMVTNISSTKKNSRTLIAKKKDCLLSEVKKTFATNRNSSPPPPPQISNGASLIMQTCQRGGYLKVIVHTTHTTWALIVFGLRNDSKYSI